MPDVAYVNGKIGPLRRARVAALDRGFLLADGVYEVLRTYSGQPFELRAHLQRLEASLRGLQMRSPLSRAALSRLLIRLLSRSGYREARIYIQVTRGAAPRQHTFPPGARPTLVIFVERLQPVSEALRRRGLSVMTLPDPRWNRCDLKTVALLPNVLAKQRALETGFDDALFVGPGGTVREAASANVFIVAGRTLRTHPHGPEILPGVSRQVVLRLARRAGLRVVEARFRLPALYRADEAFLSSTVQEVMPVVRVDGKRIGSGRPGPIAQELWLGFRELADRNRRRSTDVAPEVL